jgi:ubiquinone/menaquinone biosynthesis C-methylase UbiE
MFKKDNQNTYSSLRVVQYYTQLKQLQPAEQTILDRFKDRWSTMKMLDIGVGGGRTTQHFSQVAANYIGIDYSAEMIAACENRFLDSPKASFNVVDARDMNKFEDNSFDFILFSFNGIDYISHTDRLKVLQEISRVGKSGGFFFFSSHNLQAFEREFNFKRQLSFNPLKTYTNLVMFALLRAFNPALTLQKLKTASYAIVKDESHNFRLNTYYVRHQEQLDQLGPNFSDIKSYSWKTGLELTNERELNANSDLWLYYLCTID